MFTKLPLILLARAANDVVKRFPHKLNVITAAREAPMDSKLCKNHLRLNIDDLNPENPNHKDLPPEYKFATKDDILKAADFAKNHKVHIIHCSAGISRSPAIAYAIFRSQGMNKDAAMEEVMERNEFSLPNPWIVKLVDEIYGG